MRVVEMVRELVGSCSSVVHAVRVTAVIALVEGIIRGGRLSPATIGRVLRGGALPKHGIKRVDRLLGNPKMVGDRMFFFLAIAHRLLRGCTRPVVLVDWTQAGGQHVALVAAVPIGGRALPIYVEVHPLKKLGNAAVEKRFLCTLKAITPSECRSVIVSDAGFKGPFFQAVLDQGWDFLGRIRGTTKAVSSVGETISKEQFYARASIAPIELGSFGLFVKQQIPCRLVLVRKRRRPGRKRPPPTCKEEREMRQAALDPWLLATSMSDGDAASVVGIYARRMQIEETFRDAKNHRFGWSLGDVRLSTPQRAAVLLTLAALAILVVTLIGMAAERRGAHRAYQANTEKRRVLSFLVLAGAILRRNALDLPPLDDLLTSLALIPSKVNAR
jgi:Transposase DDE domain